MIFNLMKPVPVQDEPTMYLYGREANKTVNCNGIIVPSLPEWDKAAYPYAVMVYDTGENLRLMVFSVPAVASQTEYNYVRVFPNADGYYCMWYGTNDNLEQLSKDVAINTSAYGMSIHDGFTVWSNHDICFEDGTIFISASDPVTTYENADITIDGVGYVGAVLPKLPEWDKTAYPYAAIEYDTLYVLANEVTQTNGYFGGTRTFKAPFMKSSLIVSDTISWGEFEVGESDKTASLGFVWANHNVLDNEGATYFEESTPVPVSLPLTIFEGEVTLKQADYSDNASGSISGVLYGYKLGDTLRITLNGNSAIYHATKVSTYNGVIVGNNGLNGNDTEGVDDGGDILLTYPQYWGSAGWRSYIYIRTPGTHYVKIELLEES